MNVNGNVERFGGFEDVPELRIVEELALRMRVDDDALESQLADGAFGLDGQQKTDVQGWIAASER